MMVLEKMALWESPVPLHAANHTETGETRQLDSPKYKISPYLCGLKKFRSSTLTNTTSMSHLTVENKKNLFATYGASETNSGSIEAQVAMLTERINHISAHVRQNKKDFSSERGLVMMVGRRKRLLQYLAKKDINNYRSLIEKLGIRK